LDFLGAYKHTHKHLAPRSLARKVAYTSTHTLSRTASKYDEEQRPFPYIE